MAQETITSGTGVFWEAIKTKLNNMFTELYTAYSAKVKHTTEGGVAIKLTNRTGGASIKGTVVAASALYDSAVKFSALDEINAIGVMYEDGVADGSECWVVVSGIAEVYTVNSVNHEDFVRICFTADTGATSGYAYAEPVPTNPSATNKHFGEIGHAIAARVGAGLVKCVLHFN